MDWLTALEEKVRAATERIRELQDDKKALEARIAGLEKKLAAAAAPADPAAASWEAEKSEIRERVERLTRHLEGLTGV